MESFSRGYTLSKNIFDRIWMINSIVKTSARYLNSKYRLLPKKDFNAFGNVSIKLNAILTTKILFWKYNSHYLFVSFLVYWFRFIYFLKFKSLKTTHFSPNSEKGKNNIFLVTFSLVYQVQPSTRKTWKRPFWCEGEWREPIC